MHCITEFQIKIWKGFPGKSSNNPLQLEIPSLSGSPIKLPAFGVTDTLNYVALSTGPAFICRHWSGFTMHLRGKEQVWRIIQEY